MGRLIINFTGETYYTPPVSPIRIESIRVLEISDNAEQRVVRVITDLPIGIITIWEGDDYDLIGQWTDDDVIKRLKEMFQK